MSTSQTPKRTRPAASATREAATGAGFSAEERAAMQDRAAELKAATRRGGKPSREDGETDLLGKIAAMDEPDRTMAEQVHALISATAPELFPQTYYGMPAYAKDGKVILFFKPGQKYKMRYSTLGFTDKARLDDGEMWPAEFALLRVTADVEERITALVRRAIA
jgi:uncharacterized protein YdhG (YjbR/CyaY superfamily)